MLACLTVGLVFLHNARRGRIWLLAAIPVLSLAIIIKAQSGPFLAVGLLSGMGAALLLRRWRSLTSVGIVLAAYPLARLLNVLWFQSLRGHIIAAQEITGLMDVSGFVLTASNRAFALEIFLSFGLPTALGLLYGVWKLARDWRASQHGAEAQDGLILRVILLALAGSWLAWFLLLSSGVPRYLFPPAFLGSIFLADLLRDCVGQGGMLGVLRGLTAPLRERRISWAAGRAWLATLIVLVALPLTALSLTRYYLLFSDDSAQRTAAFFNTQTPPDTRIETYESELHFFLDRPYHWPPDQIHVELNRRSLLGQATAVDYDPLASDPDYLVVGDFARGNQLYQPAIDGGSFRLLQRIGGYEIYERVR